MILIKFLHGYKFEILTRLSFLGPHIVKPQHLGRRSLKLVVSSHIRELELLIGLIWHQVGLHLVGTIDRARLLGVVLGLRVNHLSGILLHLLRLLHTNLASRWLSKKTALSLLRLLLLSKAT